jgi:DNA polymerase III epsilon subunit-like protein
MNVYTEDWRNLRIGVFDTETTDLDRKKERIIQIGILIFQGGKLLKKYCKLINPDLDQNCKPISPYGVKVSPGAFKVHGITNEELIDKRLFKDRVAKINKMLCEEVDIWCAFNDNFDRGFLAEEYKRSGWVLTEKPCIDPLIWAFSLWPTMPNKLDDIVQRLRIEINKKDLTTFEIDNNRHRADYDAFLTGNVLYTMSLFMPKTVRQTLYVQDYLYRTWLLKSHNNEPKYMRHTLPTMPPEHVE